MNLSNPAVLAAALRGDLASVAIGSNPGGIERQEAAGQRALVEASHLPRKINGATRAQLEAIGFTFGADVDDLFVACTLPAGWAIKATDHSLHSNLVDDKGRKRAGIFYKAAFYDRSADMSMDRRFGIESYGNSDKGPDYSPVTVTDCGTEIERFGEYERRAPEGYAAADALRAQAEVWLTSHFPHWQDTLAYW